MSGFPIKYEGKEREALENSLRELMSDEQRERITEHLEHIASFYGMCPVRMAYGILTETLGEDISEEAFERYMLFQRHTWEGHIWIVNEDELFGEEGEPCSDEELFDRMLVLEVYVEFLDDYEVLKDRQADKPYREITKEDLLDYMDRKEYPKNEYTERASGFLTEKLGANINAAESAIQDMLLGMHMDVEYTDVLRDLRRHLPDLSTELAMEFVPYYADIFNRLNLSANRGYTPIEMEEYNKANGTSYNSFFVRAEDIVIDEESDREAIEDAKAMSENLDRIRNLLDMYDDDELDDDSAFAQGLKENKKQMPIRVTKIGRNDPCPCGSGKKYKKCCGKGK